MYLASDARGTKNFNDLTYGRASAAHVRALPRIVLWAWERPEDLRFAKSSEVGVAYLAQTIFLSGASSEKAGISVKPRLQPLRFAAGARFIAVTRIEARGAQFSPADVQALAATVAQLIAQTSAATDVEALQVDFDASTSQREFYRQLLNELRALVPAEMPISITALASWCSEDDWLAGVPIDEAVPMLFRMGADGPGIGRRITEGEDFRVPVCRGSIGLSTDEPISFSSGRIFNSRRIYLFDPHAWNAAAFHAAIQGELK